MEVQDGKGNILIEESKIATQKQKDCKHYWILTGGVYECPKCYSATTKIINE